MLNISCSFICIYLPCQTWFEASEISRLTCRFRDMLHVLDTALKHQQWGLPAGGGSSFILRLACVRNRLSTEELYVFLKWHFELRTLNGRGKGGEERNKGGEVLGGSALAQGSISESSDAPPSTSSVVFTIDKIWFFAEG
jgi:hypothetical protein